MDIRLPDREAWIYVYTACSRAPVTREAAEQAYDRYVAALRRAVEERRRRREQALLGVPDWPTGGAQRYEHGRIAELFRAALGRMTSAERVREREALGEMPTGVSRYRLPRSSSFCNDKGYVPDFAVDEDAQNQRESDDDSD